MGEHPDKQTKKHAEGPGYEKDNVSPKKLIYAILIIALSVGVVMGVTSWLFWTLEGVDREERVLGLGEDIFPAFRLPTDEPRLQITISDSLIALIERAEVRLSGYGVEGQTAHIPLEVAMRRMLAEGFPVRANPRIPNRARFSESGYRLTADTARPESFVFGYDTTVSVTSSEVHVPGHGPGEFRHRIRPPVGNGITEIRPEEPMETEE